MVSRVIPVEPFDLIVFGGTGDLARRKILPALFRRYCSGQMPEDSRVIGAARSEMDDAAYRDFIREALVEFGKSQADNAEAIEGFLAHLHYVPVDAKGEGGWSELKDLLRELRSKTTRQPGFVSGETVIDAYNPARSRLSAYGPECRPGTTGRRIRSNWRSLIA